MEAVIFACELAVRSIKRFLKISILRFVSSLFSMIMIALFFSLLFGAISYINESLNFKDIKSLNLYIATNPNELPYDESGLEYEKWAFQNRVSYKEKYISYTDFVVVSKYFDSVYSDIIQGGNFDSFKSSDCIIGSKIAEKYHISTGEIINIGSMNFFVIGITSVPKYISKILLFNSDAVEEGYPQLYYYRGNNKKIGIGKNYQSNEIISYFKKSLQSNDLIISMVPCAVVLLYTILSNVNIIGFYLYKTEMARKVKYFLGASKSIIIFQLFLDNFIIWGISAIISYGVSFPIIHALDKYISVNMKLPISAMFLLLSLAFIISIFFSMVEIDKNVRDISGIYYFKSDKANKK